MLYVTTRTDRDAFTTYRAMTCDRGPLGGQYLPMSVPHFGEEELRAVAQRGFHENMAYILNLLFRKNLTGRDIDLVIGKRSAEILELNSRTLVAELWRDADCPFDEYVTRLFRLLVKEPEETPGEWFIMAVRIARIFGIFGQLMADGVVSVEKPLDVAVPSMDFQVPMAVWYARSWGLPIGSIICSCNENNAPWTLLHQGELRTDATLRHTYTAACDQTVPAGLERLIHACLGQDQARRFADAQACGGLYKLEQDQQEILRRDLFISVVSHRRMAFMVPNIYRSGTWNPDPYAAMAYAGLVDHRARPGDTGVAMVIAEENPVYCVDKLTELLDLSPEKLREKLEKN